MVHVGIGYDVHALVAGRKLVLGGVEIPHEKGLEGHSDADVLLHAICDALLGAAGLGDIGQHYPDSNPEFKGVDSRKLLRDVGKKLGAPRQRGSVLGKKWPMSGSPSAPKTASQTTCISASASE